MITGQTDSGFEFELDESVTNDWEILEVVADLAAGNTLKIVELAWRLLSPEQYQDLKTYCTEDGIVKTEKMNEEITSIFLKCKSIKN